MCLPGCAHVIVDRLLAAEDKARTFFLDHGGQQFGHGQRLDVTAPFAQGRDFEASFVEEVIEAVEEVEKPKKAKKTIRKTVKKKTEE